MSAVRPRSVETLGGARPQSEEATGSSRACAPAPPRAAPPRTPSTLMRSTTKMKKNPVHMLLHMYATNQHVCKSLG